MTEPVLSRRNAEKPVLIASHPRSGTHLVIDLLRRQFSGTRNWRWWGLPLDHLYLNLERLESRNRHFPEALARRIVNRPRRAILKTHFQADFAASWVEEESCAPARPWLDLVDGGQTFYIVRHPLDVMASYHQFMAGFDADVARLSFADFLTSPHWSGETDRLGWWRAHVEGWEARPGVKVLRYEDVVKRTDATLSRIEETLGEKRTGRTPLLPPKITSITRTRLDRLTRLSPDSTGIVADREAFPAARWQEVLDQAALDAVATRLSPLLDRFGYGLTGEKVRPWPA
ncbi:sulfotransferase domain-containing protein [Citreimonas sp.]|uniref:sulfotransferase domain-containing protein n=1 Tax=Citreimonas sp. TaxID=3036715 RepID=UPI00405890C1